MTVGPSSWEAYYRVVRRIPRGKVATYAQVALLAGAPRAARHVGFALAALRGAVHRVPWQRVVGRRSARWAAISILDPIGAAVQRRLLEDEGVSLDERGRIELARFGWRPRSGGFRPLRGAPRARSAAAAGRPRSPPRTPGSSGRRRSGPSSPR